MKFLQILSFYDQYWNSVYLQHPQLKNQSYADQLQYFIEDGFGAGHLIAPYMSVWHEPRIILANIVPLQKRWSEENQPDLLRESNWLHKVIAAQVHQFSPDIIHATDPIAYDSRFFRSIRFSPRILVGWRAASIPKETDWSDFDAIFSNSKVSLQLATKQGAHSGIYALPGFPSRVLDSCMGGPKKWDLFFSGQWSFEHQKRNQYLSSLAEVYGTGSNSERFGLFLLADGQSPPDRIRTLNRGPLFGLEYYRQTQFSRIAFNSTIDFAGDEAGNMRLFETTGMGTFLLTETHGNLDSLFEPGKEIETFSSKEELLEKCHYFLAHPAEREQIARRGLERCQRDHSLQQRAALLEEHIGKLWRKKENEKKSL